jgi:hypothetical protein
VPASTEDFVSLVHYALTRILLATRIQTTGIVSVDCAGLILFGRLHTYEL